MFIFGYSSPLWLFYDVDACGLFSCASNAYRDSRYLDYAEFVGSRHYHWLHPSVSGEDAVGVVVVGSNSDGGYSTLYGYGPVAGLFHNLGFAVDANYLIGSLN